jgi:hypothetical protein
LGVHGDGKKVHTHTLTHTHKQTHAWRWKKGAIQMKGEEDRQT